MYAVQPDTIFVNLFAKGTADVSLPNGRKVRIAQETRYPWDGVVRLTVTPDVPATFVLKVRIPGWARNEAVPSDLYRFADENRETVVLRVNGSDATGPHTNGYVDVRREWKKGDVVELALPMPVRRVVANEKVEADRGRVALQRGPIVFAAEWADNPNGKVRNLVLLPDARLTSEFRKDLLNGVQVIRGRAASLAHDARGKIVRTEQDFTAIPYATWANRGRGEMIVWLAASDDVVRRTLSQPPGSR
jgi:uncharacterized protein